MYTTNRPSRASWHQAPSCFMRPSAVRLIGVLLGTKGSISTTQPKRLGSLGSYGASGWSVFRFIQLPKIGYVLTIAVLLRFMDSFMIFAEPFVVTGGGPGNSTTFMSIDLENLRAGNELGEAAAISIIYFLIILLFSWVFYTVMTRDDAHTKPDKSEGAP